MCWVHGKLYVLERNSLVMVRPREIHQFLSYPTVSERPSLFLNLKWLGEAGRLQRNAPTHVKLTAREASLIISLLRRARQETEEKRHLWKDLVRQLLDEFLLLARRAAMRPIADPVTISPLMRNLIENLETRHAEPMTLASLGHHF